MIVTLKYLNLILIINHIKLYVIIQKLIIQIFKELLKYQIIFLQHVQMIIKLKYGIFSKKKIQNIKFN